MKIKNHKGRRKNEKRNETTCHAFINWFFSTDISVLLGGCGSAANNKASTKQTKEKTTEQKKKKKRKER